MGHRSDAFQADFDRLEEAVKLGEQAITFLGRIDCLVNNSGITFNKPFLEVTPKQFDRLYHVNVRAQYFLTQCVVQDMLTHDGSAVCNISSIHGVSGAPEHSVYAGTKGALIAQTRSLAVEMAHQGIRINAIAPGYFATEMNTALLEDKVFNAWVEGRTPAGRWAKPEELGGAVVFLASDAAAYVNGHILAVDGGLSVTM